MPVRALGTCLEDALMLLLFVRLCRHYVLYDNRPCRVAHQGLAERTERDDFVVGLYQLTTTAGPYYGLDRFALI